MDWVRRLFDVRLVVEVGFLVALLIVWGIWWKKAGHIAEEKNAEQRERGARVLTNQVQTAVTGASIVMAGSGALLGLLGGTISERTPNIIAETGRELFWAAFWALAVIFAAAWLLGYIASPSVIHRIDVSRQRSTQLLAFATLVMLFLSACRLIVGIGRLASRL